MKYISRRIICLLMTVIVASTLLAGCANSSGTNATNSNANTPAQQSPESPAETVEPVADPMAKYDPPITVTSFFEIAGPFAPYFSEERVKTNIWSTEYVNTLGINIDNIWYANQTPEDSVQKKNVAIASGEIPDFMMVSKEQLVLLEKSDLINKNLGPVFEQYASELTKKWAYDEGDDAMNSATFAGNLIAMPLIQSSMDLADVLWVRQDWLDKLGAKIPTTTDELYNLLKEFKENDPDGNGKADTIGLIVNKDLLVTPSSADTMGLFNAFDAFPQAWVDDGSGNLVYGSTQPQMKDALSYFAKLYADGLLETDFAVKDIQKVAETAAAGTGGVQYGANWNSIWPLQSAIDNNPNAAWTPVAIPTATGKPVRAQNRLNIDYYFVVSKNCEHPEALFKLLNLFVEKFSTTSKEEYAKYLVNDTGSDTFDLHGTIFKIYPPLRNLEAFQNVEKALEENDTSPLNAEDLNYYNSVVKFQEGDLSQAGGAKVFGPGGSQSVLKYYFDNDLIMRDRFYGAPTATMSQKMQMVKDKEMEYYTKVIMGEDSVDNFDRFVADLTALGLDKITQEVNEWNNR